MIMFYPIKLNLSFSSTFTFRVDKCRQTSLPEMTRSPHY